MSLSDRIRPNVEAAPWVVEEVKMLEAEVERLRHELSEAVETYTEARRGRWHCVNGMNEAIKERDEARASCETLANDHIWLTGEMTVLRKERDDWKRSSDERNDECNRIQRALNVCAEERDQLRNERDEARREADRLRHGNTVEGDFVCPNEEERTRAQARLIDAALIHADLVRERDEARKELAESNERRAELRMGLSTTLQQRDEARAEVARLRVEVGEWKGRAEGTLAGLKNTGALKGAPMMPMFESMAQADFRRGAEAMREACAEATDAWAKEESDWSREKAEDAPASSAAHAEAASIGQGIAIRIRALDLPIPEDKP